MNTFYRRLEFHVRNEPLCCREMSLHIWAVSKTPSSETVAKAEPLTFRTLSEEEQAMIQPETMRISPEDAQQLMDELYRAGVRPTEGAGSVGQLAAVNRHLEDMRALVFKKDKKGLAA